MAGGEAGTCRTTHDLSLRPPRPSRRISTPWGRRPSTARTTSSATCACRCTGGVEQWLGRVLGADEVRRHHRRAVGPQTFTTTVTERGARVATSRRRAAAAPRSAGPHALPQQGSRRCSGNRGWRCGSRPCGAWRWSCSSLCWPGRGGYLPRVFVQSRSMCSPSSSTSPGNRPTRCAISVRSTTSRCRNGTIRWCRRPANSSRHCQGHHRAAQARAAGHRG